MKNCTVLVPIVKKQMKVSKWKVCGCPETAQGLFSTGEKGTGGLLTPRSRKANCHGLMNNEGLLSKCLVKGQSFLFSGLKEGCSGLIGTERSWEGGARRKCQQLNWASAAPLVHSLLENGIEPLRKPCVHLVCEQLDDCLRILWPELIHSNCSLLCMLKLHSEI